MEGLPSLPPFRRLVLDFPRVVVLSLFILFHLFFSILFSFLPHQTLPLTYSYSANSLAFPSSRLDHFHFYIPHSFSYLSFHFSPGSFTPSQLQLPLHTSPTAFNTFSSTDISTYTMLIEINCASDFLCRYVASASSCTPQIMESFKSQIMALMQEKYTNHWDPQRPHYGNGYRAITSFGGKVDPLLCEVINPFLSLLLQKNRSLLVWFLVLPSFRLFRAHTHRHAQTHT